MLFFSSVYLGNEGFGFEAGSLYVALAVVPGFLCRGLIASASRVVG